jgi:hexokinase
MEWGNFDRIPRNGYDHALDRASSNPGRQCLEKMASGLYMGEIARRILVEMMRQGLIFRGADPSLFTAEYSLSAEQMAVVVQGGDFPRESGVRELSEVDRRSVCSVFCIVSRRAARLAATAIAAVVLWMDKNLDHFHTIAVDGSLFLKYPGFQAEMLFSLADLLGDRAKWIKFAPTQDGSGTGAAIVAAVASFARAMD